MTETLFLAVPLILILVLSVFVFLLYKRLSLSEAAARHREQNLRYEMYARLHPLEETFYRQQPGEERVLYDGHEAIEADDFTGSGSRAWDYTAHAFETGEGEGSFEIDGAEIAVHRTNATGRFELHLCRYVVNGKTLKKLPPDPAKQKRLLRLQCEVKRGAASQGLRFVFKGEESKEVLDEKDCIVFSPDWQTVSLYFSIQASEPTHLRIDNLHVKKAPDSVRIRKLVLFEKC